MPYLSIAIQDALSASLDEKVTKLELVDAKLFQSIDRLREYRSALITAAVTGQIDVTTWDKRGDMDRRLDAVEAVVDE